MVTGGLSRIACQLREHIRNVNDKLCIISLVDFNLSRGTNLMLMILRNVLMNIRNKPFECKT